MTSIITVTFEHDEEPVAPSSPAILPSNLSWPHAAVLIAKLQFGLGVLGIPATFYTLGLFPGVICLLALSALATYAGLLVTEIRLAHPNIHNVADLGYVLFGKWGRIVFGVSMWTCTTLIVGAAMVTTSIALNAITNHGLCTAWLIAIAAGTCFVVGAPLRHLQRLQWLGWFGLSCVLLAVYILIVALLVHHHPAGLSSPQAVIHRPLFRQVDLASAMTAVGLQLMSLMGTLAFYSVSAEMETPKLFNRAVIVGQGVVTINYLGIGVIVFLLAGQFIASPALGTAGPWVKRLCYAIALPGLLVSALLFANVGAKFMEKNVRKNVSVKTCQGKWLVWLFCYTAIIVAAFFAAELIPIFDTLMGLIGTSAGPLFMLGTTGLTKLYLLVHSFRYIDEAKHRSFEDIDRQSHWMRDIWRATRVNRQSYVQGVLSLLLILAGVGLTVCGLYGSAMSIKKDFADKHMFARGPFSCVDNSGYLLSRERARS